MTINGLEADGNDVTVDEAGLPARAGEPEGSNEAADSETAGSSFTFAAADGFATVTIQAPGGGSITLTPANVGSNITGVVLNDATGTLSITGFALDAATGQGTVTYSYTLDDNVDHPANNDFSVDYNVVVTDTDGDSAGDVLSVAVLDDVPTANNDADSVTEDGDSDSDAQTAQTATGNVLTGVDVTTSPDANATDGVADVEGADGASVTAVSFGSATGSVDGSTAGAYGTLTLNADGSYSYVLDNSNATVQGLDDTETLTETFTYTIRDGDGDTDTATLTITVNGVDDGVTITNLTPALNGGDVTVDEDDLADGSDLTKESLTQSGTFNISTPDGLGDLVIGGETVIDDGVFTPTTINEPNGLGTLNITGFNPSTGLVSYTFTLTDNATHATGNGENDFFANFPVVLTDADGDSASDTLSVRIIDDVPSITTTGSVATLSVDESDLDTDASASFAGNFNVVGGADGAASVDYALSVTDGTASGVVDTATGQAVTLHDNAGVIEGRNTDGDVVFTLSVNASGSVELDQIRAVSHPDTSNPDDAVSLNANVVTLTATVTDGDGDEASSSIQLGSNITFEDDAPSVPSISGLPEDGISLTVEHLGEVQAGFRNSYGYVFLDANGEPISGEIIWANVNNELRDGVIGTQGGTVFDKSIPAADYPAGAVQISFFLIPDGHELNAGLQDNTPVTFQQNSNGDWEAVSNGTPLAGRNAPAYFRDASLNPDGFDHESDSAAPGNSNWEDLLNGGDTDFTDFNANVTLSSFAAVDEDDLPNGSDPTKDGLDTDGFPFVTGELIFDFGADGPADGSGPAPATADPISLSNEQLGDLDDLDLTSGGVALTYSYANGVLTAQAGGADIFEISFDASSMEYTFTLKGPIDHADGNGENVLLLTVPVTITDGDGDSVESSFIVRIIDDVPEAVADADEVNEGESTGGNVLTGTDDDSNDAVEADVEGADGVTVTSVGLVENGQTVANSVQVVGSSTQITGSFGVLTLNSDGSYSYQANADVSGDQEDVFVYTITDADGDTDDAHLTISVADLDNVTGTVSATAGTASEDSQPNQHVGDATIVRTAVTFNLAQDSGDNETISEIRIDVSSLPAGAQVFTTATGGTALSASGGVITVPGDAASETVYIQLPNNDSDADFTITYAADVVDPDVPGVTATQNNLTVDVVVDAVADQPEILSSGVQSEGIAYVIHGAASGGNDSVVSAINLDTGVVTELGTFSGEGLAFDNNVEALVAQPDTNPAVLFGFGSNGIYKIVTEPFDISVLAANTDTGNGGAVFAEGTLYYAAVDGNNSNIYSVDTTTGVQTLIAETPANVALNNLTFDASTGTFYAIDDAGSTSNLVSFTLTDLTNGGSLTTTAVGSVQIPGDSNPDLFALAFSNTGELTAIDRTGGSVIRIDISNPANSAIVSTIDNSDVSSDGIKNLTIGENNTVQSGDSFSVTTTVDFDDVTDGSESHFVLFSVPADVTLPTGSPYTVETLTAGNSYNVPAGDYVILEAGTDFTLDANGTASVSVEFEAANSGSAAVSRTVGIYGVAREDNTSGGEPNTANNISVVSQTVDVDIQPDIDVQNTSLTVDEAALDLNQDGDDLAAGTETGSDPSSTAETASGAFNLGNGITLTEFDYLDENGVSQTETLTGSSATVTTQHGTLEVNSDGSYTFTLTDNADHSGGAVAETITATFSNGDDATLSVNITDDVPSVSDDTTALELDADVTTVVSSTPQNIGFVIDDSGSISTGEFNSMINGIESFVNNLRTDSADDTNLAFSFVSFSGSSSLPESVGHGTYVLRSGLTNASSLSDFVRVDNASSTLQSLLDSFPRLGGGTNFDAGLDRMFNTNQSDYLSSADNPVFAQADVVNRLFFLSDGQPNRNTDGDSSDLNSSHVAAINNNSIQVTAVGIGSGVSEANLRDYFLRQPGDDNNNGINSSLFNYVAVSNFAQLAQALSDASSTLNVTYTASGNLFDNLVEGADGARLSALSVGGVAVTVDANGNITVPADAGFTMTFNSATGAYSITFMKPVDSSVDIDFSVVDGDGDPASATETITDSLTVQQLAGGSVVIGTSGADGSANDGIFDTASGDTEDHIFVTRGGDDTVWSGGGDDLVIAGSGNDTIFGEGDDDLLIGGLGNDSLFGGSGDDILIGGVGNDLLSDTGNNGSDTFVLSEGTDTVDGFNSGQGDKLNLHDILSDLNISDSASITVSSGELRADGQKIADIQSSGGDTTLTFGTTGNASIGTTTLQGVNSVNASDFTTDDPLQGKNIDPDLM